LLASDNLSVGNTPASAAQPPSDAALIARSLGEPEVFSTVFDRHFAVIHRYLARRVGSTRADDLASQTFAVAFERRATFDQRIDNARPWLFGIATNLMRNETRAERRLFAALARLQSADAGDVVDDVERTLARLDATGEVARIAALLADLDADQRDVLLLHAWGDLSYEEIASALSLPVGTVRSRLSRVRSKLRDALADPDTEGGA
jgi:RNA polymerase sigma-70 factor (ECF subfamily)